MRDEDKLEGRREGVDNRENGMRPPGCLKTGTRWATAIGTALSSCAAHPHFDCSRRRPPCGARTGAAVLRCRQGASGPNYRLFWSLLPHPLLLSAYLSSGCSFVRVFASPPRLPSPSFALFFGAPVLLHPLSRCSPPSHHAAAHSVDIECASRGDCRFGLPSSTLCCIDVIVVICSVFPLGGLCGVRFVRGGNQDPPWRSPPITHPAA